MTSGAERDAMQIDAHQRHDEDRGGQHQRDRQGDDEAGAPAECDERHDKHDGDRFGERLEKLVNRLG